MPRLSPRTLLLTILALVALALAGCGGGSEDERLPTRFILPTLAEDETPDPVTEVTAQVEATGEVTPGVEATAEVRPSATPTASPTAPGAVEVTDQPPVPGVAEEEVIRDFAGLEAGDQVTLGGTIALAEDRAFLVDERGVRVQVIVPLAELAALDNAFVIISGVLEAPEGVAYLALRPSDAEAETTPEVTADPQSIAQATQNPLLAISLPADLPALATYDALLPFITEQVADYALVTVFGSTLEGWRFEFYREADGAVRRYNVSLDGTVQLETNARLSLPPEGEVYPLDREQLRLDSDDVYNRVDLTTLPDFAIPLLRLTAPEPDRFVWTVELPEPVVFDATETEE